MKHFDAEKFADKFSYIRAVRDLPLREVAKQCGISAATLSRLEKWDDIPETERVYALLDWMGVSADDFRVKIDAGG